jgi:hypothetical protein
MSEKNRINNDDKERQEQEKKRAEILIQLAVQIHDLMRPGEEINLEVVVPPTIVSRGVQPQVSFIRVSRPALVLGGRFQKEKKGDNGNV